MTIFPQLITLAGIAEQLGVSQRTLQRNMNGLRASGFPQPVIGCAGRYDPQAVADWLGRQRTCADPADPAAPARDRLPNLEDISGWQSELLRRLEHPSRGT